jgi:hypothetical protein
VPITVAARSKTLTVFARLDGGILVSNSAQGIDVRYAWVYSVFVLPSV